MKRIPGYVYFMIIVTFAYLSVELAFSAYLNLFMSSVATSDEVHHVESFGRVMTGIALAIFALGIYLPRVHFSSLPLRTVFMKSALLSAAIIGITYKGLDIYAQNSAKLASNADLRKAFVSVLARDYIAHNGIDGQRPDNNDTAWRSLLSTVAVSLDADKFAKLSGVSIEDIAAQEAQRQTGSPEQFRDRFFGGRFDEVRKSYNEYVDGSNEYVNKIASIDADGQREWEDYMAKLHEEFPDGIPLRGWSTAQVRNRVMQRLPVSSSWNIVDRSGFMAAYRQVAVKEIKQAYADNIQAAIGYGNFVKPGLSFDAFLSNTVIQQRLHDTVRSEMGIDLGNATVYPGMSDASFKKAVYVPALMTLHDNFVAMISDDSSFDNSDLAEKGRAAYQAATLPGLAILLSLAGAALHIFKFSSYVAQAYGFIRGNISLFYGKLRFAVGGAVLAASITAALFVGNTASRIDTYHKVSDGTIYAQVLEKTISVQPGLKVLADTLQKTGLWTVVSAELPAAKPYKIADAQIASRQASNPAEAADDVVFKGPIPVPTPRPSV